MSKYTFGFIFEQTLGHVTHSKNLTANVEKDTSVNVACAPISFEATGLAARIPLYKSNWTIRAGLRARHAVRQLQREQVLDALFVHTQVPAVLMTNWLKRIPAVVSLDATPKQYDQLGEFYGHQADGKRLENLKWRANQACFHHAARLVTWSMWAKQGLIDEYGVAPDKITVIPPGVNLKDWPERDTASGQTKYGGEISSRNGAKTNSAESNVSRKSEPVKILFVGADLQRKGGSDLIEAFRSLRVQYAGTPGSPAVELHLVTRSPVAEEPGIYIYNKMEPNSPELKQLFGQSHLFCLPTYGDCLPMVLAEASAVGLPLISTDVAAISEIVKDGETGLLVPPGDVEALIGALRVLIDDEDLRSRIGKNAAILARRDHDGERNAFRLLDIMKELSL